MENKLLLRQIKPFPFMNRPFLSVLDSLQSDKSVHFMAHAAFEDWKKLVCGSIYEHHKF